MVSGIAGLAAVVPFVVGQNQLDIGLADPGVQINLWMHVLGSAGTIAAAVMPALRSWITDRP